MRLVFLAVGIFAFTLFGHEVLAYQVLTQTVDVPYEVVTISGDPTIQQSILGELDGSPEMFEIVSETPFVLTAEIRAVPGTVATPDFGGIIIRQKEIRGVEEVARLKAADAGWTVIVDPSTGLRYQAGPFYSEAVPAGMYRIEVSTPENIGKYILVIGDGKNTQGYFASLAAVAEMYRFYGVSKMWMFSSPYVHYPIGILVLAGLIVGTWYFHKRKMAHA